MGIQKMKEAMVAAGLREPTFASDAFFRATFQRSPEFALKEGQKNPRRPRYPKRNLGKSWLERLAEKLAENQKMIIGADYRNPRISNKTMAIELGISTTAIDKTPDEAETKRLLRRVGPDKGGHWEVVQENEGHGHGK